MKRLLWLLFGFATVLTSCSKISNRPVIEKLSIEELSSAVKSDTSFSGFYDGLRKNVDELDDLKKAKYNDVTYRRLFSYYKFLQDTTFWKPLVGQWEKEWAMKFGSYSSKGDSTIKFWKKYRAENSLNKYVKIELVNIRKEFYESIGELREVSLGFKLTPLQGT
ncbi:MAG: hypothetical protein EOO07_28530, partial [Chitinophagaceae bacterium]